MYYFLKESSCCLQPIFDIVKEFGCFALSGLKTYPFSCHWGGVGLLLERNASEVHWSATIEYCNI